MTTGGRKSIRLIVNADDYGYFPCVSQGILDAAAAGKLTATGILANSPDLDVQLKWLDNMGNLDCGVHLNLTSRQPLTSALTAKLAESDGCFPGVFRMSLMVIQGRITLNDVRNEWRAQIEACQGRKLHFLNSHEHIHMLPALFPLVVELAADYRIPYVRLTRPEWLMPMDMASLCRNVLMQCLHTVNWYRFEISAPLFLGLSCSGKLSLDCLAKIFARLEHGKTYELMCHPGRCSAGTVTDSKLLAYHRWETELAVLLGPGLQGLYDKFGISLAHYRN